MACVLIHLFDLKCGTHLLPSGFALQQWLPQLPVPDGEHVIGTASNGGQLQAAGVEGRIHEAPLGSARQGLCQLGQGFPGLAPDVHPQGRGPCAVSAPQQEHGTPRVHGESPDALIRSLYTRHIAA